MLRKTSIPLLSRSGQENGQQFTANYTTTTQPYSRSQRTPRHSGTRGENNGIPSIRLINATPSAAGDSSMASSNEPSWSDIPVPVPTIPAPLLPSSSANKRKLVPKKSKLNILTGSTRGSSKEQYGQQDGGRSKDFSDVVRRVGSTGPAKGGFEIHVDSTEDPDLGELVVVKKQKSRGALNGMRWGALGDVTNVPKNPSPALSSGDEKPKEGSGRWWALGRGRKDSKDKEKEKNCTVQPVVFEPAQKTDGRSRFNSLDSGLILETKTSTAVRGRVSSAQMLRIPPSPTAGPSTQEIPQLVQPPSERPTLRSTTTTPTMSYASNPFAHMPPRSATPTPTMNGLLAPPTHLATIPVQPEQETLNASNSGSIAVRAMRSMRSMARLGGWAKAGDGESPAAQEEHPVEKERTLKDSKSKKTKKSKKAGTVREKEKSGSLSPATLLRLSSSSFEAGNLSPSPARSSAGQTKEDQQTLGKKKKSVLGLGLGRPSTMRLPSINRDRSASSASSTLSVEGPSCPPVTLSVNRLSAESMSGSILLRARSGSGASSLRPTSTCSGLSRNSSNSGASVRWDEACLRTARERRKVERQERRESMEKDGTLGTEKGSRHSAEGRRRTSLMDIWPETRNSVGSAPSIAPSCETRSSVYSTESQHPQSAANPLVTLEEATSDGHSVANSTPPKRARPRPVSEQMLGKSRPAGMYETQGQVLSILDAATNDLAQLINTLDLEATPHATPDMTPHRRRSDPQESPTKFLLEKLSPLSSRSKTLRESSNSMASLRTAVAAKALSNNKSQLQPASQTRRMVSQQIAPWPAADTELSPLKVARAEPAVIEPLKGVKKRLSHQRTLTPSPAPDNSPSFQPLRPAVSRRALNISPTRSRTPTGLSPVDPVFNKDRINSMLTFGSATSSRNSSVDLGAQPVFTKPPGHKRQQSSLSHFAMAVDAPEAEAAPSPAFDKETKRVLGLKGTMGESSIPDDSVSEDPDSDIPDELQAILGADSPAMLSRSLSNSPDSPPSLPLPTLDAPPFQLPAIMLSSLEQDTMTSLSPTSDTDDTKKSFDFTGEIKRLNESGVSHRRSFIEQLENAFKTPAKVDLRYGFEVEGEESFFKLVNGSGNEEEDVPPVPRIDPKYLQQEHELQDSVLGPAFEDKRWSAGDGELNKSFRFGGRSPQSSVEQDYMDVDEQSAQPTLTLSDIIPPPGHSPSPSIALTEEDSSVLNSIYEKAQEAPALNALLVPRPRVNSDTSVHRMSSKFSRDSFFGPSARSSIVSFTGLDSFEQVRRGFEFHDNRPNFYPPAANSRSFSTNASRRVLHSKHESTFSVASISSVGHVLNNGVADPFDYGLPSLQERPSSEDLSLCMSGTVDDTFSFMHHLPPRQRADSDASSFYFRPSTVANSSTGVNHRRRESGMSISSLAPPISLYNRSFAGNRSHHIRNDSSSSFSSLAHNYALHGANGGRAAWARHRQETSMDSVASDFSAMRLGRPGIGDKMFETAGPGAPLTSILASPMEDSEERGHSYGSSYDSIMDGTHRSSLDEDSLFEKTGYRSTSISDESIFGDAPAYGQISASQGYRPLSVLSFVSDHPPEQQDDTMISMLGGGHVRRLSVGSMVNASPCVNKRKYSHLRNEYRNGTNLQESPKKARIVEKPSFAPSLASVSSFKFGEERMVRATKGHFHRDSLEESCLIGQGEDNSVSLRPAPIFSRPVSSARSRSSTITTSSSGVDTPPLSSYDSSSQSEGGSVSSIDLSHVNSMLINATHPMTTGARARARARGRGHRTRFSQSHLSRSSVYETIEEEQASVHNSPAISKNSPTIRQAVYIVDPQSPEYDIWDDEQGIEALRRYYALRDEAQNTVTESKQLWEDTPFSLFALQSFTIPRNPAAMQALLEHSVKNYGNLPSELRQRTRSRTSSRASPYPTRSIRTLKSTTSPESRHQPTRSQDSDHVVDQSPALPLKRLLRDANLPLTQSFSNAPKPWESPEVVKPVKPCRENAYGLAPDARPRVGSGARRAALGWSKRSNGPKSSTGQKENAVNVGQGTVMTPSEGLRINRPRPKGRPTPASTRFSRVAAAS